MACVPKLASVWRVRRPHLQSASVSEGLFVFELFEENTSAVVLSCGSYITGTHTPGVLQCMIGSGTSHFGDPARFDKSCTTPLMSVFEPTVTPSTGGTESFYWSRRGHELFLSIASDTLGVVDVAPRTATVHLSHISTLIFCILSVTGNVDALTDWGFIWHLR